MAPILLAERTFTPEDQLRFADLSGDRNPLHLDEQAARRSPFGCPVVHGVHFVLWTLESYCSRANRPLYFRSLRIEFARPLTVGRCARCTVERESADRVALSVGDSAQNVASITLDIGPFESAGNVRECTDSPYAGVCRTLDAARMPVAQGSVPIALRRPLYRAMFPSLDRYAPAAPMAELMLLSTIVGMECPGTLSLLSEIALRVRASSAGPELVYRSKKFDRRFSLATISVEGAATQSVVKAFLRPGPQQQPPYAEIAGRVAAGEFAGRRALVVGGSRGLGEITAKLLAAGGAEVLITYHRGMADAERVAVEISAGGKRIRALHLDITDIAVAAGELRSFSPDQLYYFATPTIFSSSRRPVDASLYVRFCEYYLTRFAALIETVAAPSGPLAVFYPSTVMIDDTPQGMTEYAAAKAAGEALCAHLARANPSMRFHAPRLPRLPTDQTLSVVAARLADPVAVMLAEIRTLMRLTKELEATP